MEISLLKKIRIQSGYKAAIGAKNNSDELRIVVTGIMLVFTIIWVALNGKLSEGANPDSWVFGINVCAIGTLGHTAIAPFVSSAIAIRKTYLEQVELLKTICQNGVKNDVERYIVDHWERMQWTELFETVGQRGVESCKSFVAMMYELDLPYEVEEQLGTLPLSY